MSTINLPGLHAKKRMLGLAIGVFGLTTAVACTGLEGLDPAQAEAIVQNVDSLSGEVTVQLKDGTTTTFNMADVDIEALSQLIGQVALEAGDEIELGLDDSNSVTSVTTPNAKIKGSIVSVDSDANTVLIEASNGIEITLDITAQTRIELDGDHNDEDGTVDDLLPGMMVKVKYDVDTSDALKIEQEDEHNDGSHDDEDDEGELKGVITAIAEDARTVTVADRNGDMATYTVLTDTKIKVDGPASFADLQVGMDVVIEFNPVSLELREVEVEDGDHHGAEDDEDEGQDEDDD